MQSVFSPPSHVEGSSGRPSRALNMTLTNTQVVNSLPQSRVLDENHNITHKTKNTVHNLRYNFSRAIVVRRRRRSIAPIFSTRLLCIKSVVVALSRYQVIMFTH